MAPSNRSKKTAALKPRSGNMQTTKKPATNKVPTKKAAGPKSQARSVKRTATTKKAAARPKDPPAPIPEASTNPPSLTLEDVHRSVMAVDIIPGLAPQDQRLVRTATGWTKLVVDFQIAAEMQARHGLIDEPDEDEYAHHASV
jgi:hypothetical protein